MPELDNINAATERIASRSISNAGFSVSEGGRAAMKLIITEDKLEAVMMKSSMTQIETNDVNDDPEVSRVERSSSRQSPDHVFPGPGTTRRAPLAAGQRWSVARKREVVLGLLRGE